MSKVTVPAGARPLVVLAVVLGGVTLALVAGTVVFAMLDHVPVGAAGAAGGIFGVIGGVVAARRPSLVVGWLLLVEEAPHLIEDLPADEAREQPGENGNWHEEKLHCLRCIPGPR